MSEETENQTRTDRHPNLREAETTGDVGGPSAVQVALLLLLALLVLLALWVLWGFISAST